LLLWLLMLPAETHWKRSWPSVRLLVVKCDHLIALTFEYDVSIVPRGRSGRPLEGRHRPLRPAVGHAGLPGHTVHVGLTFDIRMPRLIQIPSCCAVKGVAGNGLLMLHSPSFCLLLLLLLLSAHLVVAVVARVDVLVG